MVKAVATKVKTSRTRTCFSRVQRDIRAKVSWRGASTTPWPTHASPRVNTSEPIKPSGVVPELTKVHSGRLNECATAAGHVGTNWQPSSLPRATNEGDWSLAMPEMLDI